MNRRTFLQRISGVLLGLPIAGAVFGTAFPKEYVMMRRLGAQAAQEGPTPFIYFVPEGTIEKIERLLDPPRHDLGMFQFADGRPQQIARFYQLDGIDIVEGPETSEVQLFVGAPGKSGRYNGNLKTGTIEFEDLTHDFQFAIEKTKNEQRLSNLP